MALRFFVRLIHDYGLIVDFAVFSDFRVSLDDVAFLVADLEKLDRGLATRTDLRKIQTKLVLASDDFSRVELFHEFSEANSHVSDPFRLVRVDLLFFLPADHVNLLFYILLLKS